jgi:hypothetical protein
VSVGIRPYVTFKAANGSSTLSGRISADLPFVTVNITQVSKVTKSCEPVGPGDVSYNDLTLVQVLALVDFGYSVASQSSSDLGEGTAFSIDAGSECFQFDKKTSQLVAPGTTSAAGRSTRSLYFPIMIIFCFFFPALILSQEQDGFWNSRRILHRIERLIMINSYGSKQ